MAQVQGLTYPIAIDAPRSAPTNSPPRSATSFRYFGASHVVIDRAGRIAYAGHSLGDAVKAIAGLLTT
jgi:hypothetical protein